MLNGVPNIIELKIFDVLKHAGWLYERTKEILTIPVVKAGENIIGSK